MISFTVKSVKKVQCHLYFLYMLHVTHKLLFRCRSLYEYVIRDTIQ